jgi:hypothetical protein
MNDTPFGSSKALPKQVGAVVLHRPPTPCCLLGRGDEDVRPYDLGRADEDVRPYDLGRADEDVRPFDRHR